jgi:hypothetical protein
VWQLAFSSHCCDESLAPGEWSFGAVRDEDDLDLWSCLKNVSKDESGKVFESSKIVLGVIVCVESLGSLYEHFASVGILVFGCLGSELYYAARDERAT